MKKYTLPDYAFQFVTVTAGVLIALFIDGLVETNHNRELVVVARDMLRREVGDNLKELSGLSKSVASSTADIENGLKLANDLFSFNRAIVRSGRGEQTGRGEVS
jgi:hypothetical protein